jgi:hypothetical protein
MVMNPEVRLDRNFSGKFSEQERTPVIVNNILEISNSQKVRGTCNRHP